MPLVRLPHASLFLFRDVPLADRSVPVRSINLLSCTIECDRVDRHVDVLRVDMHERVQLVSGFQVPELDHAIVSGSSDCSLVRIERDCLYCTAKASELMK